MLAYGMGDATTLQIESATLSFLEGRFSIDEVRNEFQDAVEKLQKSEAEFRKIDTLDTLEDANNCTTLREKLQRIIQMPQTRRTTINWKANLESYFILQKAN